MMYRIHLFKLFFSMDNHFHRIRKAETLKNVWKWCIVLCIASILLYGWMAYLGIGSDIISGKQAGMTISTYEGSKFGFLLGRLLYAVLLSIIILFLSAVLFYVVTDIPFQKLLIMQQVVLLVMLVERLLWIPFMVYLGLDWYVSPLSLGIVASYVTTYKWFIYFFGAISLVQVWVIGFQIKYLSFMGSVQKRRIVLTVIGIHIFYWAVAATLTSGVRYVMGGGFG